MIHGRRNWYDARKYCHNFKEHYHSVKTESQTEFRFIINQLLNYVSGYWINGYWTGLHDRGKEGTFVWEDGTLLRGGDFGSIYYKEPWLDTEPDAKVKNKHNLFKFFKLSFGCKLK